MKLIWTKSKTPFSAFVRWGLGTDCSHFALVFNAPAGGLMFESNLLGSHPKFFKTAKKKMTVVHEISLDLPLNMEDKIWDVVVDELDGKPYDFVGFFYFVWRAILWKFFSVPFPKKNKWQDPSRPLCVAVIKAIETIHVKLPKDFDPEMNSPHELFILIEKVIAENQK